MLIVDLLTCVEYYVLVYMCMYNKINGLFATYLHIFTFLHEQNHKFRILLILHFVFLLQMYILYYYGV